jgi:valyl-tRNA synthetase
VKIIILKAGETLPTDCAVFPISADANVYLEVKDRVTDATQEVEKFKAKVIEAEREQAEIEAIKAELSKVQDKDVTDALQTAESRKRVVEARLWALQETVIMFENMKI